MNRTTDMTNVRLARWTGIGGVVSLLVISSAIGTSYGVLATEGQATRDKVDDVQREQKVLSASVKSIEVDVAVIKNDQRRTREDVKRVLTILERRSASVKR